MPQDDRVVKRFRVVNNVEYVVYTNGDVEPMQKHEIVDLSEPEAKRARKAPVLQLEDEDIEEAEELDDPSVQIPQLQQRVRFADYDNTQDRRFARFQDKPAPRAPPAPPAFKARAPSQALTTYELLDTNKAFMEHMLSPAAKAVIAKQYRVTGEVPKEFKAALGHQMRAALCIQKIEMKAGLRDSVAVQRKGFITGQVSDMLRIM
jgi:hypothetical protein